MIKDGAAVQVALDENHLTRRAWEMGKERDLSLGCRINCHGKMWRIILKHV
jgi:hypothetical protein